MDLEAVTAEIVALHEVFERWFRGDQSSLDRVEAVLAPDFLFVGPDGAVVPRNDLLTGLTAARASSSITIRVENVDLRWRRGDLTAATYEEWQTVGGRTTSRLSTAVFETDDHMPGGLRWLSVHETWLSPPASD